MLNQFSRTELLLGKDGMEKLYNSHVAIFGVGGVGGYVAEGLVRSGITKFDLIDDDKVCLTNLNRQIIATHDTVGKYKVDVMKDRILSINPNATVNTHKCFYMPDTADTFDLSQYDYIVDATQFQVADIYKTSVCPLARVMRRELKKRNIKSLKVVYSQEQPIRPIEDMSISCRTHCICPKGTVHKCTERRDIPGSTAFVPSVVGLIIAGEIVKDIALK